MRRASALQSDRTLIARTAVSSTSAGDSANHQFGVGPAWDRRPRPRPRSQDAPSITVVTSLRVLFVLAWPGWTAAPNGRGSRSRVRGLEGRRCDAATPEDSRNEPAGVLDVGGQRQGGHGPRAPACRHTSPSTWRRRRRHCAPEQPRHQRRSPMRPCRGRHTPSSWRSIHRYPPLSGRAGAHVRAQPVRHENPKPGSNKEQPIYWLTRHNCNTSPPYRSSFVRRRRESPPVLSRRPSFDSAIAVSVASVNTTYAGTCCSCAAPAATREAARTGSRPPTRDSRHSARSSDRRERNGAPQTRHRSTPEIHMSFASRTGLERAPRSRAGPRQKKRLGRRAPRPPGVRASDHDSRNHIRAPVTPTSRSRRSSASWVGVSA